MWSKTFDGIRIISHENVTYDIDFHYTIIVLSIYLNEFNDRQWRLIEGTTVLSQDTITFWVNVTDQAYLDNDTPTLGCSETGHVQVFQ